MHDTDMIVCKGFKEMLHYAVFNTVKSDDGESPVWGKECN